VVQDDEEHGHGAEEDGEAEEIVVRDHCGWLFWGSNGISM
jgi:hypothetical protein